MYSSAEDGNPSKSDYPKHHYITFITSFITSPPMKKQSYPLFFLLVTRKEKMLLNFKIPSSKLQILKFPALKQGTIPSQGLAHHTQIHRTNQPNSVVTCVVLDFCFRSLPKKKNLGHLSIYFEKNAQCIPIPP